MAVALSLAAKAALIAVGGVLVTVIAIVTILILYCCTCHRRVRGEYKVQTRSNVQPYSQEQPLSMGGSVTESRTSTGQSSTERLVPPLAMGTLQNGLHQELEARLQARASPTEASSGVAQNDLEISQRTWSAYETLPRNIKQFDERDEQDFGSDSDYTEAPPTLQSTIDDIDTIDNDAYSTSTELAEISRHTENSSNSDDRHRTHLPPPLRMSTISNSSTGSGYVINSLHSPNRTSCYSTSSDGYVISHLEWTKPSHVGQQPRPPLPCITETTNRASQVEYLTILPN